MLEFERDLIPIFRDKFGFFGYDQEVEILRVREDRNKCAHPSFYSDGVPYKPNAELARLHIVNAIEIVLSQQPRQGKFATEQFINVISDRYFPEDPEDILARLKSLGLERARESLIISLIDEICFSLAEEKPPLRGSINGFRAVEAIVSIHPDIAAPRLRSNIVKLVNSGDPKAFECSCVLVCRNPDVAETLDDGIRSAIRAWVPKQTTLRGGVLARAVRISWLKEIAIQESEHITREDLKGVAIPLPDEILSAFARRYAQSSNWNEANENYQSFISPYLNRLREKEIRLICNSAITGEGDLLGSHGFKEFIRRLHAESPAPGIEAIIADCGITPDGKIIH